MFRELEVTCLYLNTIFSNNKCENRGEIW